MRFSLRLLFGLTTGVAVCLALVSSIIKSDEYVRWPSSAVWYLPTADAEQLARVWLDEQGFSAAEIPPGIRPFFDIRFGGSDADYARAVATFRNDELPGIPVYATLGVAPVDDRHAAVRIEFESQLRLPLLYWWKLPASRGHITALGNDAQRWLDEKATETGAPEPFLARRFVRCKRDAEAGTAYELEQPLAEFMARFK